MTEQEQAVVIRCLRACRPVLTSEDREIIDAVIEASNVVILTEERVR